MIESRWEVYKITEYGKDGSAKKTEKVLDLWLPMAVTAPKSPEEKQEIAKENGGDILAPTNDDRRK